MGCDMRTWTTCMLGLLIIVIIGSGYFIYWHPYIPMPVNDASSCQVYRVEPGWALKHEWMADHDPDAQPELTGIWREVRSRYVDNYGADSVQFWHIVTCQEPACRSPILFQDS